METTKPQIPSVSPLEVPNLLCSNPSCLRILTPQVIPAIKGKDRKVIYRCEPCGYEHVRQLNHSNGQERALTPVGAGSVEAAKKPLPAAPRAVEVENVETPETEPVVAGADKE